MKKVFFKTFGCRTNIFDTQVMINSLKNFEVTDTIEESDYIVVNSCTVTNSADTNARQFVHRVSRLYPDKKILFTGCGISTQGKRLFEKEQIFTGFGHSEKEKIEEFLKSPNRRFVVGDLNHLDSKIVDSFIGKSRAFIKIQEGCNFSCSYCIIPSVRGRSRSYDENRILEQIRRLASNGFGEFILTGTNIGSYGDGRNDLARLLKKISQIRGVRRIRLGSVEPSQIGEEFREILQESWLGRYLHIAIQYSDNRMLKIMNRRNRVERDIELFHYLSNLGYALGTDFIVGHPGESEEIFNSAIANLEKYPLTHIHLFRYSPREGTTSSKMKPINGAVAQKRYKIVDEIVKSKRREFIKNISQPLQVLIETKEKGYYKGYDQYYLPIYIQSDEEIQGEWIEIENRDCKREVGDEKV